MKKEARYFTKGEFGIMVLCVCIPLAFLMAVSSMGLSIVFSSIVSIILLHYIMTEDEQAGKKIESDAQKGRRVK